MNSASLVPGWGREGGGEPVWGGAGWWGWKGLEQPGSITN